MHAENPYLVKNWHWENLCLCVIQSCKGLENGSYCRIQDMKVMRTVVWLLTDLKKTNTWSRASYHISGSEFIEVLAFLMFLKSDMGNTTPNLWKGDQQSRPKDLSVRLGKADIWKPCISSRFRWTFQILIFVSTAWVRSSIFIISKQFDS